MNPDLHSSVEALGWALLHFLWQGAAIAALLAAALRLLRRRSPQLRYGLACLAMVAMLAAFGATLSTQWSKAAPPPIAVAPASVTEAPGAPNLIEPAAEPAAPTPSTDLDAAPAAEPALADPNMLPIDERAAQAEPATAAERIRPALPWIVGVWALGVALLSARLLSGWLCLRRWRASGEEIADPVWRARFAALGERMRLSRPVRLLASASAAVPMVAGWLKPVVLMPAGLFTGLDAAQLEAILAHELAHIRRHDYLVNLLQNAVETLFFFHPAVWWISGEIRQEREHCCDDEAAALCGGAVGYARALAALEEIRSIDGAPLGAVSAAGGSLLCRVRRLLGVSFREPSATVPWSVGIAAALLAAGLIVGAHVVNAAPDGKAAVELPDAPDHNLAAALVERWQTLEGKNSPIPEARVAGMRRAIDQWNEENRIETDVVESVYALKGWASDQRNHPVGEVKRWLNAIAAITSHPVQIALNNEPMIGRVLKEEELAKLAFGPPSESGLRAAWSLSPNKDTYVFGDIAYGTVTLWNASGETIMTGNGWGGENRALPLIIDLTAKGEGGRNVPVHMFDELAGHSANWRLQPGEVAQIGGYRLKIGPGEPREGTGGFFNIPAAEPTHEIEELKSGEEISLSAMLPYPKADADPKDYPPMQTGALPIKAIAPADVKAWLATGAGRWELTAGVKLEIRQEVFHGADVLTTAVLTWPDGSNVQLNVAADAFANREPWAMAWDAVEPTLWVATGPMKSFRDQTDEMPAATRIKRIDFRDPRRVEETSFEGWPNDGAPSEECRAKMAKHFEIKGGAQAGSRALHWATANPASNMANSLNLSVFIEKGGKAFRIDTGESERLSSLAEALREAAADKQAKWDEWLKSMEPAQRAALENTKPTATIYAYPETPFEVVSGAIKACEDAGLGPKVAAGASHKQDPPKTEEFDEIGESIELAPQGIVWSEPNGEGLRLGVSGIAPNSTLRYGDIYSFSLFARNDSESNTKFSWITGNPLFGVEAFVSMIDNQSNRHPISWIHEPHEDSPKVTLKTSAPKSSHHCELAPGRYIELCSDVQFKISKLSRWELVDAPKSEALLAIDSEGTYQFSVAALLKISGHVLPADSNKGKTENGIAVVIDSTPVPVTVIGGDDKMFIRGVSLADVPTIDDITTVGELYEPDPDHPGEVRRRDGMFSMSVGDAGPGPWLYYAAGADHFYLQVRPDPEVVSDVTYGPISGNPVARLDLAGWLNESAGHRDPGYARRVAHQMIKSGDTGLARLALGWVAGFEAPSPPDEHASLIEAIDGFLKKHPGSPAADEARRTRETLAAKTDQAREAWEAKRQALPEEQYQPGDDHGAEHKAVVWGEPNAEGMRLGVSGIDPESRWAFGELKTLAVYVCNDGGEPVKFAWTPRTDDGLRLTLVDGDGQEWNADIAMFSSPIFHSRCRLAPGQILKVKPSDEFTLIRRNDDGTVPGENRPLNNLAVPGAGEYALRVSTHLGIEDWSGGDGHEIVRPQGEWAGTLTAKPINIAVTNGDAEPEADEASAATGRREGGVSRAKAGEEWDAEKLANLPFGPAAPNGLRVARFFEPPQKTYEIGARVAGRIVFCNTGAEPIEFTTEDWHQRDAWHLRNEAGEAVEPLIAERMGFRGYPTFRLEPGQVCEVAAQGVKLGSVPYDDEPGAVFCTVDLPAEPGDAFTCWWDVTLRVKGDEKETTIRSGDFAFKTKARPADYPVDLGIARWLGKYHLAEGVKLQLSQGAETTATIEWDGGTRHQIKLEDRGRIDPVGLITWWRGGEAIWICGTDTLRKIDFADPANVKESSWSWNNVPPDLGGAPEKVQAAIRSERIAATPLSFHGKTSAEWDEILGHGGIRNGDREALQALGYGSADSPTPAEAVPLLRALAGSDKPATVCRSLGLLSRLKAPSDEVLDTFLHAITHAGSGGNRTRAGYMLGKFPGSAAYTVPRLVNLLGSDDTVTQGIAALALGQIGPAAQDAIPALEALRPQAGEQLKAKIDAALKAIRGENEGEEKTATQESGIPITAIDAATHEPIGAFRVIAGVPSGVSQQFDKEHGVNVINWQPHTIRESEGGEFTWPADRGYAEMAFRIEADGYVPHTTALFKKGEPLDFHIELKRDAGVAGSVLTPGAGRPAHDATVVLAMIRRNARLKGTTFPELAVRDGDSARDRWERPTVVQPDEAGRFTLPDEPDPTAVVLIIHGDGVYVQPFAEWKKSPQVVLERWGRIHGHVRWGDRVGAGEKVDLIINRGDAYGYPDIIAQYDDTVANEDGIFVFERVLPGHVQLSCPIAVTGPDGKESESYVEGRITHAQIKAPHTTAVIGGKGRTVTGKLVGFGDASDITFHLHPNAPHIGFPGDDQQWAAWSALQKRPEGELYFRSGLNVAADGTFEIPGMLPGYYQIFFSREGVKGHIASSSFRIPAEDYDGPTEPMSVGEIKVR